MVDAPVTGTGGLWVRVRRTVIRFPIRKVERRLVSAPMIEVDGAAGRGHVCREYESTKVQVLLSRHDFRSTLRTWRNLVAARRSGRRGRSPVEVRVLSSAPPNYTKARNCGIGEIGSRTGFKTRCRKTCGFESRIPHQYSRIPTIECFNALRGL